jgi:hypothetical protein
LLPVSFHNASRNRNKDSTVSPFLLPFVGDIFNRRDADLRSRQQCRHLRQLTRRPCCGGSCRHREPLNPPEIGQKPACNSSLYNSREFQKELRLCI